MGLDGSETDDDDNSEFIKDQFDSNFSTSAPAAFNPALARRQHSDNSYEADFGKFIFVHVLS